MRCEQFCNNAGGFNYGFSTAKLDFQTARDTERLVTPAKLPISSVPTGWLLFWDYGVFGHVAFKAPGNRALMASSYVTEPFAGGAHGYVSAPGYGASTGHRYLGASPWHGNETLQGVGMLTSSDKAWIRDVITNSLKAERDDIASSVWGFKTLSAFGTGKKVPVLPQLMAARKDSNHASKVAEEILKEVQKPGE